MSPFRWIVTLVLLIVATGDARSGLRSAFVGEGLTTEDVPPEFEFRVWGSSEADVDGGGTLATYAGDADWAFAFLDATLGGALEFRLRSGLTILDDSAGVDLPGQLVYLAADVGWIAGNKESLSFELRLDPGVYSDVEDFDAEALDFPFSLAFRQVLDADLIALLGLQIRPGFPDQVMPIAGVIWDPSEPVLVTLCLPESRVIWHPVQALRLYAGAEWSNMGYDLNDDEGTLTLEEILLALGVGFDFGSDVGLELEWGRLLEREIEIEDDGGDGRSDINIDSATFIRFGFFGPL